MRITAVAPANIAFIKYWGRRDAKLRIPYNPSISMNLSDCTTTTTVEFSDALSTTKVTLQREFGGFVDKETERVIQQLDRICQKAGIQKKAEVVTSNSFPKSSGIASSASGFAALTVAAAAALGLKLSEKELTELARLGSGSACRSIPDGFVKWDGEFAYSLYPHDYWDLRDIVVIVGSTGKDVSSSDGHDTVETSPLFKKRLADLPRRIQRLETALQEKNFKVFGETLEEDCLDMHHVMQTQSPPLYYWNAETVKIMEFIKKRTVPAYFTIDAGPNVHVICEGKDEEKITKLFKNKNIIVNRPAKGAHLV